MATRRDLPSQVELDPGTSGLDEISCARCEDVKSVSERRLIAQLGTVEPDRLSEIARVLRYLLEL